MSKLQGLAKAGGKEVLRCRHCGRMFMKHRKLEKHEPKCKKLLRSQKKQEKHERLQEIGKKNRQGR